MEIRERILSVYRGEYAECMPVAAYTRYLPRGKAERYARNMGLGVIDYVPVYSMLNPPWHMLDGYLSEISNGDIRIEYRWDGGRHVERRMFSVGNVSLYADIEKDPGGVGSEYIRKRYISNADDYAALLRIVQNSIPSDNREMFSTRSRDLAGDGVVLARLDRSPFQKLLIELVGPEQFFFDIADDDGTIEELLHVMEEAEYAVAEKTFDSEAEVVWLPDNVTSEMTTPKLFEAHCIHYYMRLAKLSHETGKPLLVHFDGKIKALAPLIKRIGITAIDSLSLPEMSGDVTLSEARALFPNISLLCNFPSNKSYETEDTIRAWVRDFTRDAKEAMPCMLQLSEDVPIQHWAKVATALAAGAKEVQDASSKRNA